MAAILGLSTGKSAVLLAILAIALSGTLSAGRNRWTPVGPEGGNVLALAADPRNPGTLYAATCGSVFKTIDAGASWTAMNVALQGIDCEEGEDLAVDPQNSGTVYAVSGNQIFKTTDGGARWSATTLKTANPLGALRIAPGDPNTLYAGDGGEVFRSADGGATWTQATLAANLLAVDPQNPDTLYATAFVTGGSLLLKSTDGGVSWNPLNSAPLPVLGLAIDPQNPETLYAGGGSRSPGPAGANQIFKSTDGGASWNPASLGLPLVPMGGSLGIFSLAVSPQNPAVIYALISVRSQNGPDTYYVAISKDGVASWTTVTDPGFGASELAPDPGDPGTLYLGTGNGVLKTADGGGHWDLANSGLRAAGIGQVVVDSQTAGTLFVRSDQRLLKSADGGKSWSSSSSGLTQSFGNLVADPQDSRTLYIMASECSPCGPGPNGVGLFKSQDAGGSWVEIYHAPLNSALGLVAPAQFPNVLYANIGDELAKSSDGGYTWIQSQTELPTAGSALWVSAIVLDPQDSNAVYAGTQQGWCECTAGLWKSADAGVSWMKLPGADFDIGAVAIGSRNPGTLYFADIDISPSLHKSTDGGQTWTATRLPPDCCFNPVLVADPQNSGTLYYSGGFEVFESSDAGASWKSLGPGLRGGVYSLALDPQDPATLYAGTRAGLFVITLQPAVRGRHQR
jgi:photosystem II stability/assembly factor-like uncharacterized protein